MNQFSSIGANFQGVKLCNKSVAPLLWAGRKVLAIFKPLSAANGGSKAADALTRLAIVVALVVLPLFLICSAVKFLVNKCRKNPVQPPISDSLVPQVSVIRVIDSPNEAVPVEAIKEQLRAIEELLYDRIFKNLDLIDRGSVAASAASSSQELSVGTQFWQSIDTFREQYQRYETNQSLSKTFETFNHIVETATRLKEFHQTYREVKSSYLQSERANAHGIIEERADGNCWLYAALKGLHRLNIALEYSHQTLRPLVVEWMEKNVAIDQELAECIAQAIDTHKFVRGEQLQKERSSVEEMFANELIDKAQYDSGIQNILNEERLIESFDRLSYFEDMKQEGSFGSRAELYTLSKLFAVNVMIWREVSPDSATGPSRDYDPPLVCVEATGSIEVVLNYVGNHFNSKAPEVR